MARYGLTLIAAAQSIFAASCWAQETFLIRPQRASTPTEPVVSLEFWAEFDPADFAFAGARFSIEAGDGRFYDTECGLHQPGCDPYPLHDGRFIWGVVISQVHFPPAFYADPANPILAIKTKWQPTSLEPRDVALDTITREFVVFLESASPEFESRMATFTEGSAIIRVRRCYADCDGTDDLDFLDFLCFQDAFATDDFYADCDGSGELDFFDFLCFQNEFVLGCG